MRLRWLKTLGSVSLAAFAALPMRCSPQEPPASLEQADADYRAGVAALSHNDLKAARADFERVVRLAPSAEKGHSALGAVLVRLGENSAGIAELEKALAMKAEDTIAQQNLALAFEQAGQPDRAIPWFAKLEAASRAAQKPLPADVLAAWAGSLAAVHQDETAIAKMKEALAEAPRNADLWDELGSLYGQRQEWADAEQAFKSALEINPSLAVAHFHLGMTLDAQQLAAGPDELRKACDLAPGNVDFLVALGQALTAQGKDAEAVPVLQRAVQIKPGHPAASYQLGLALQRSNQVSDAIPLFETAAAANPANAEVLTNLGTALLQVQRAKDAVPVLQRAVTLAPQNPTAHQDLAAAYIQLSRFNDAVSELQAALKLSPDAPQLHYNLGLAFKMEDDAAHAIPEFEAAEKLNPSASEPPYALGLLYLQGGRYADAERELNASLKLQPANGDGWATLGSVENHLDKLPEAASALQEAIRQRPDQPDPHLMLAAVLVKQNQPTQAADQRKRAAELMRANMNRQRAEVASNSGNDMLKKGQISDAIVDFQDALSYDPDYVEAHIGLADALQQQGKIAEAAAEREKAEALEKQSQQQDHP